MGPQLSQDVGTLNTSAYWAGGVQGGRRCWPPQAAGKPTKRRLTTRMSGAKPREQGPVDGKDGTGRAQQADEAPAQESPSNSP